MKWVAGIVVLSCSPLASAFVLIDDFKTGSDDYLTKSASYATRFQSGSMMGDTRMTVTTINSNESKVWYDLMIAYDEATDTGRAVVDAGARLQHETTFSYGNAPAGVAGGFVLDDLNLDLSGEDRLRINFESNDLDLLVRVNFRSSEQSGGIGEGNHWYGFERVVVGGRSDTAFYEDFLFSSIPGFDFSNVDQIAINFVNRPSGDFSVTQVAAVPEPGTLALLGGFLALAYRRRRR